MYWERAPGTGCGGWAWLITAEGFWSMSTRDMLNNRPDRATLTPLSHGEWRLAGADSAWIEVPGGLDLRVARATTEAGIAVLRLSVYLSGPAGDREESLHRYEVPLPEQDTTVVLTQDELVLINRLAEAGLINRIADGDPIARSVAEKLHPELLDE